MTFQWLNMRISEEQDRRHRQAQILERLPRALDELHRGLVACVDSYAGAFGPEASDIQMHGTKIRVTVREEKGGKWEQCAKVEATILPSLPGFRIERGAPSDAEPLMVEVGLLPGDKLFYRDGEQYLSMEELTRRVLDRAFFPNLGD